MTGGGFEGRRLNIVDARHAGEFKEKLAKATKRKLVLVPQIYICKPAKVQARLRTPIFRHNAN